MISYSGHARARMKQRSISEDEVEACVEHFEVSYKDRKGNPVFVAHVGGRRIKVVTAAETDPLFVITVAD